MDSFHGNISLSSLTTSYWESASGFIDLVHSYVEKSWELVAQYENYLLEIGHL
jgi:hypothetical protein